MIRIKFCLLSAAAIVMVAVSTTNLDAQLFRRGCRAARPMPVTCCQPAPTVVQPSCCGNTYVGTMSAPAMPVQAMPVQAMPVQAMPAQVMPTPTMPMASSCCGGQIMGGQLINNGIVTGPGQIDIEDCDVAYMNCLNSCQSNCGGSAACSTYCSCDKAVCEGGSQACSKPGCLSMVNGPGL